MYSCVSTCGYTADMSRTLNIRLPDNLYALLQHEAEKEGRSLNNLIVWRLSRIEAPVSTSPKKQPTKKVAPEADPETEKEYRATQAREDKARAAIKKRILGE